MQEDARGHSDMWTGAQGSDFQTCDYWLKKCCLALILQQVHCGEAGRQTHETKSLGKIHLYTVKFRQ